VEHAVQTVRRLGRQLARVGRDLCRMLHVRDALSV
jgi:hypothetical protein